jgi:PPOX class probable F420-dependent enzyme
MTTLDDPQVRRLLEEPNHATVSTLNADGTVHGTVVWADVLDGSLAVNTAVGRHWPNNLERDPRITVVIYDQGNPYEYVEIKGRAAEADGAEEHIDRLAQKYIGQERYPWRQPDEERVKFQITPERVRHATA